MLKGRLHRRPFSMSSYMSEKTHDANLDLDSATRHINEAFKTSNINAICRAIGDVIRLHNISQLAEKAGLERPSLYRAFGGDKFPNFSTVLAVLDAMNLQLKVTRRRAVRKSRR
jgi:probable addiction module antidote protein